MDEKESTQNVSRKKDENNYLRAELSRKLEELLTLKKKQIDFKL